MRWYEVWMAWALSTTVLTGILFLVVGGLTFWTIVFGLTLISVGPLLVLFLIKVDRLESQVKELDRAKVPW